MVEEGANECGDIIPRHSSGKFVFFTNLLESVNRPLFCWVVIVFQYWFSVFYIILFLHTLSFYLILFLHTLLIMASNLAPPSEEITLEIDLINPDSISKCLRQYLHEAPKSWIRIQGSHSVANQALQLERVVDFDMKIRGLNARLARVELGSSKDDLAVFFTSGSDQNSVILDEETIQRCCTAVIDLAKRRSYDGYADCCYS